MNRAMLTRSSDLIPGEILAKSITIVGAGAVGSFTTLCLAKMGFVDLTVFDDDTVSEVNLGNQFYRFKDIGKPKVEALAEIVKDFSGTEIKAFPVRYTGHVPVRVVVAAVDSMASRKDIWGKERGRFGSFWFVDPRMGAEQASIRIAKTQVPDTWQAYERTLWDDSAIPNEPCTAKSTVYTAASLGATVAQTVRDLLLERPYQELQWDVGKFCMEKV